MKSILIPSFRVLTELNYCERNPDTCINGAKCISLTKDEGSFRCFCREGTSGRYCEFSLIHTVKPITSKPPAVIPLVSVTTTANTTISEQEEDYLNETTTILIPTTTIIEKLDPAVSDNET